MAKFVLTNPEITVNSVDLSDHVGSVIFVFLEQMGYLFRKLPEPRRIIWSFSIVFPEQILCHQ